MGYDGDQKGNRDNYVFTYDIDLSRWDGRVQMNVYVCDVVDLRWINTLLVLERNVRHYNTHYCPLTKSVLAILNLVNCTSTSIKLD